MTVPSADQGASIQDLLDEFEARALALGVAVERLPASADAAASIATLARELDVDRALVSSELHEDAPGLIAAMRTSGPAPELPGDPAQTQHERFGISLGRLAIAETGSVLLAEESLADRAIGMLVAVQVIICRTNVLAPSLDEAGPVLRELALRPGGSYSTLVTGPSRTADIERVLTVGVQGPGRLVVLFVDDLG